MRSWISVAACVLALGVAGCGDKGGGGSPLGGSGVGGSSASGSGSGAASGVVGSWEFDVDALVDAMLGATQGMMEKMLSSLPPEAQAEARKQMPTREKMKEDMSKRSAVFTFSSDGTASFVGKEEGGKDETGTGTWKQDGDKVIVTPKTKDGKPVEGKDASPKTLRFRDGALFLRLSDMAGDDTGGMPEEMKSIEMRFKRK